MASHYLLGQAERTMEMDCSRERKPVMDRKFNLVALAQSQDGRRELTIAYNGLSGSPGDFTILPCQSEVKSHLSGILKRSSAIIAAYPLYKAEKHQQSQLPIERRPHAGLSLQDKQRSKKSESGAISNHIYTHAPTYAYWWIFSTQYFVELFFFLSPLERSNPSFLHVSK